MGDLELLVLIPFVVKLNDPRLLTLVSQAPIQFVGWVDMLQSLPQIALWLILEPRALSVCQFERELGPTLLFGSEECIGLE
jgi:hypothetical protein